MNRLRSACVETNSSRTCFISLSGDLAEAIGLRIQGQPFALQLQWTDGKAFTSWSGEVIRSVKHDPLTGLSSIVQLGKKFADSLGLNEKEQVLVEPVLSIPSCNRISVDPVSANDWEILELHAGYIESQLLNQVRVVFPGQVLPIWIQSNICVVVKIVNLEPNAECVRLDEFTEVIVSPKTRNLSSSKDLQQTPPVISSKNVAQGSNQLLPIPDSRQHSSLTSVSSDDNSQQSPATSSTSDLNELAEGFDSSLMSRFSGYLQSWFYGHYEQSSTSKDTIHDSLSEQESISFLGDTSRLDDNDVKEADVQMCLRVQPELIMDDIESNKADLLKSIPAPMNYYSLQPSAVFVDYASLPPLVLKSWTNNLEMFPPSDGTVVKTVQISKLLSPKEKAALRANSTGANSRENTDSRTQNPSPSRVTETTNSSSEETTTESSVDRASPCWTITMVMTSSERSNLNKQESCKLGAAKPVLPGHIAISTDLQHLLGVKDLSLVKVQSVSYGPSDIKGIILHPHEDTEQKLQDISGDTVLEAFQDWICSACNADQAPLVLCNGMLLSFVVSQECHHLQFIVTVLSHQQPSSLRDKLLYYQLTPDTLNKVTVVIGTPSNVLNSPDQVVITQDSGAQCLKHRIADLGGITDIFYKCLDHALSALRQRPLANHLGGNIITGLRSGALLVCGSGSGAGIGCGKTALAHAVCHQLQQWPVCAHVTVVDCIPFRGKRVDAIQRHWQQVFGEAAWYQPSVILFDDLDQIVSAPSALQEMGGEALYKRRLAQVFKELIATEIDNNSRIVVIATSRSHNSLHPSLLTSRGCHVFQCCVELQPPDANQRREILCAMMNKRFSQEELHELDLSSLVKKTEGFSPKDLGSLLDRALHKAALRNMKTPKGPCYSITTEDFKVTLEGFTPAALRGVTLHTAGELGWSDVGGLAAVKGALMETFLWPTKYSWLFSKCPLRMRSGLLLYGPPGTGKTLLAGVVAKECGLNFISIKGPELLSKYIGASEQAVRDMFTRAQSAKPCILFFDEFDSLAPRRGHDSTGVTDRVVNQLLTQLDGVEGLDGVYVLAATSRPDLIDPALLRPGRLDKSLYCGIPEKSERLEILQALSRPLVLAEDIDLAVISDMCENFTGADFKALLYNAQLAAIHRNTSSSQLYKGLFNKDIEKQDNKRPETEHSRKDVFYIPSLVKGVTHLPKEEQEKLHSEVMALQDHLQQSRSDGKSVTADTSKNQPAVGIEITQSDLLQAASSMGPSVSDGERHRYQAIYDAFIKSGGGEFAQNTPGQGKATLA